MEIWKGKIAVVTGASAGIGAAICKELCKWNITVVGMARRLERLNELKTEILSENRDAKFYQVRCDVTKEDDIKSAFEEVIAKFGGVDILINNAGVAGNKAILDEGSEEMIHKIIQTNLIAVISCIKKGYKSMVDRDVPGYIINMSSIAGHVIFNMPGLKPKLSVYPSTKFGLTALNQVLRHELNFYNKNKIRMSNISPGMVKTEIIEASGNEKDLGFEVPFLEPSDIADAVIYLLSTPPRVQIQDIIIKPTGEFI